jgi:hypothetical protein
MYIIWIVVVESEKGSHDVMSADRQRLGEKIGQVEDAGDEHDAKLALIHAIADPIEALVQGLAELWRHGAVGEPDRALVVAIDDSGRLGVPEVDLDLSLVEGDASGGEDAGDLGLGDERDDHGDGRRRIQEDDRGET